MTAGGYSGNSCSLISRHARIQGFTRAILRLSPKVSSTPLSFFAELAKLEHRLWAASRFVQDTRFRATCAVSGQLVAAQQRTLGTASGTANPMKIFLGHELQSAPYPRTYPCKQACSTTDRVSARSPAGWKANAHCSADMPPLCRMPSHWKVGVGQSVPESRLGLSQTVQTRMSICITAAASLNYLRTCTPETVGQITLLVTAGSIQGPSGTAPKC